MPGAVFHVEMRWAEDFFPAFSRPDWYETMFLAGFGTVNDENEITMGSDTLVRFEIRFATDADVRAALMTGALEVYSGSAVRAMLQLPDDARTRLRHWGEQILMDDPTNFIEHTRDRIVIVNPIRDDDYGQVPVLSASGESDRRDEIMDVLAAHYPGADATGDVRQAVPAKMLGRKVDICGTRSP